MKQYSFEDLKDKVCVLTGATGVLGSELAKGLASVGVKVVLLSRSKETTQKLADEIIKEYKTVVLPISADVTDKTSLENAKKVIIEKVGNIDILINGAGGNSAKGTTKEEVITEQNFTNPEDTFFGLELEGFQNVFDLNFLGTFLPTFVFAKEMVERKSGVILNISSMSAFRPLTKVAAYSAAKSSVNSFTEWLAVHFAKMNVRVNAIAPGFFLTNQNRFLVMDEKTNDFTPRGKKIVSNTPMGKFGEPGDIVGASLFLISNLSNFITGVVLPIDGGFNIYSGV